MIHLRALEPSDVDRLYVWENNPDMWRYGFSPAPLSRHQIWEYVHQYDANPLARQELRLMIDTGDETVGTLDLYEIDAMNGHAFIGIMVASPYRRLGYAAKALQLAVDYCRNNLRLHQIAATVAEDNTASCMLFKKCGFKHTATLPQWIAREKAYHIDARIFTLRL